VFAECRCDTSLRILETQDDFVQLKTSQILTVLLRFVCHSFLLSRDSWLMTSSSEKAPLQQWQLQPLLNYLSLCVQGTSQNKRDVAVQCLEAILPRHEVRQAVWAIPGILNGFEISWSCCARQFNFLLQISGHSQIEPESSNELSSWVLLLVVDI
jgi:hypothetical protein